MKIEDLTELLSVAPQVDATAKYLGDSSVRSLYLDGLTGSAAPVLFAAIERRKLLGNALFVLNDEEEAGYFYHDLTQMLGNELVLFYPSSYRRAIKYAQRDAANEILRTEVLSRCTAGSSRCLIVSYPEALAELVISQRQMNERTLSLKQGQQVDTATITAQLREFGFHEVDYVYEPGQFALRGSILDVFSFSCEYPFRVDFFGDDIDSIRTFDVADQLSRERRESIQIVPELSSASEERVPFFSFLPADTLFVTKDLLFVRDAIDRIYREGFSSQAVTERMEGQTEQEQQETLQQLRKEAQLITGTQFSEAVSGLQRVEIGTHATGVPQATLHFQTAQQPLFHKNFDLLRQSLSDYLSKGYRIYVLADSIKQLERLKDIFSANDGRQEVPFTPVEKTIHEGFIDHDLRLCVFTDHQIFDRFHKYSLRSDKARSGKVSLTLKEIRQFEPGDYVVHVDHGIGRFGGLVRMPQEGGYQEMIKIIYNGGDTVYVSIHSLYKVSKYKAQDNGEPPHLSKLGTGQWERLKERTKNKLKDIARDLIHLYAQRRRERGFAFSADSFMQHELEASFLYEDTPDQLKATNDIKADMEKARPMDRLVCGDVGFGKTEVAVRAAFKAACDSKQVAVLVPTTVLAYQHYQTFRNRLKDLPVRVDYLSRARSAKETRELLQDLADGKVDIIVGTHKLIGKSVKFHDLGLLIIDEEQKFGVSTKEKLRQMKTNVDTLTMTATPIPRTLQFSLLGARDLSIIQTPPPNRYPIHTEIHTFGPDIIADAINFEMSRNGQVYFVNPRINDLQRIADLIHNHVPDARVAIGHGRMEPSELEQTIFDFANHDYDVLLSTTIVENGIDIPNANTIIINGANHFGLADLHQMRGRVGRSNRKAFCYLLAPPLADLPQESRRRLEALENFSDLGSGIQIAMQDLDLRGAGNLLGAEQSGFIADLGYETYQKILTQAVTELKNEEPELADATGTDTPSTFGSNGPYVSDCTLESDLELYFPDQYVPSDSERMLLYRELDNLQTDEQLAAYRKRMEDRFGPVPPAALELMHVVTLRRLGCLLGCEKIILRQGRLSLHFVSNPESPFYQSAAFGRILDFAVAQPKRCQLRDAKGKRSLLVADVASVADAISLLSPLTNETPQ